MKKSSLIVLFMLNFILLSCGSPTGQVLSPANKYLEEGSLTTPSSAAWVEGRWVGVDNSGSKLTISLSTPSFDLIETRQVGLQDQGSIPYPTVCTVRYVSTKFAVVNSESGNGNQYT